jgi:hypothetical protein
MQNPMTPVLPVQSARSVSQVRAASTSANTPPRRSRAPRTIEIMHRAVPRSWKKSGATARKPADASQSAWLRRSWVTPRMSWMTTTPGHGPSPSGTARYAGTPPRTGIATSATVSSVTRLSLVLSQGRSYRHPIVSARGAALRTVPCSGHDEKAVTSEWARSRAHGGPGSRDGCRRPALIRTGTFRRLPTVGCQRRPGWSGLARAGRSSSAEMPQ